MLRILSLILIFGASSVFAVESEYSAVREPGTSYKAYMNRARTFSDQSGIEKRVTPMGSSQHFGEATLSDATAWESEAVMVDRFKQFRDLRFLFVDDRPDFARRSSWMYPDDGCFARAALANRNLAQMNHPVPKKVFAFGDLQVESPNAQGGSVSWWYHVAPIVQIEGEKYVLDPAISPKAPLKLADWLARMNSNPGSIEVAICESGTYTPGDDCTKTTDGEEKGAEYDQEFYLRAEWSRLVSLGRDPERELGEFPPWLETASSVLH